MTVVVTNGNKGLEPSPLSSTGLLLYRHDLQHLVLEGGSNEHVDDLVLLNREREKIDLFQALDLSILYKTAELGHRDPILLLLSSSSTSPTTSTVSSTSSPSSITSSTSISESSSESTTFTARGWSTVRHFSCRSESSNISLVVLDLLYLF